MINIIRNEKCHFHSERKYRAITFDDDRSFVLGAPEFLTDNKEILDQVSGYSNLDYVCYC